MRRRRPSSPAPIPVNPCLIESFLTSDPNLKQVVSRTFELGLRGKETDWNDGKLEWSAGLFHAMNFDDILALAAPETGRGYFANVGDTLRQGVELGMRYTDKQLMVYANYALVDATIQTNVQLPAPNNPTACSVQRRSRRNSAQMRPRVTGCPAYPNTASRPASSTGSRRRMKGGVRLRRCQQPDILQRLGQRQCAARRLCHGQPARLLRRHQELSDLWADQQPVRCPLRPLRELLRSRSGQWSRRCGRSWLQLLHQPAHDCPGAPLAAYGGVRVKF